VTVAPIICSCGATLIPGPRGGMAQNYYCTNRASCRQGFNVTIWRGKFIDSVRIGEVDDERYAMYGGDDGQAEGGKAG